MTMVSARFGIYGNDWTTNNCMWNGYSRDYGRWLYIKAIIKGPLRSSVIYMYN